MIICLKNVFIHQHNFEDTQKMHKPKRIPPWQIMTVKIRARVGSPRFDDTANGRKNGMTSSLAMACNKRGAPVRLCRPAPSVDKNDPIRITHSLGQAMLATTNFPPIDAPNLFSIFVKFHLKQITVHHCHLLVTQQEIVNGSGKQKDRRQVHSAGGQNGRNCSDRDTLLCIGQITGTI